MVGLSALFGALAGVSGTVVSSITTGLSTGPTIVLCASVLVLISLTLAPNRGLMWRWARRQRNRQHLKVDAVLADLFTLASQHEDIDHGHSVEVLRVMGGGQGGVARSLREMESRDWVRQIGEDEWSLTPAGLAEAERMGGSQ
jgi:manganese/zinc/iron transport system permease protein